MNDLDRRGFTACLMHSALAAGTTTTYTTVEVTNYAINGKTYTKAAATNAATPTTDINTGVAFVGVEGDEASVFVLGYNAAGTILCAQGDIVATDGAADGASATLPGLPNFPTLPEDFCPIGYVVVKVGTSAATWTFGASNLAGPPTNTGIDVQAVMVLPNRPQSS